MIPAQHDKFVSITPPAAIVDNASYTTTAVDTKGYAYLRVFAYLGATDIAMTALKLQESDDSGMSGAADITGLVYGTSSNVAGSTSALAGPKALHRSCRHRWRWIDWHLPYRVRFVESRRRRSGERVGTRIR